MEKQIKAINFEIKDIDEKGRSFLAVASTEDVDRDGDRIMATGWDLASFKQNPVIPWAHNYSNPPIAKAAEIFIENNRLMFRPIFASADDYPFADTIWKLYKGGFLKSFSVGFRAKRWEYVDRGKGIRGRDFSEQELWEISACTIPSNPNALIAAKSAGVITDEEVQAFEDTGAPDDGNALKTSDEEFKKFALKSFEEFQKYFQTTNEMLAEIRAALIKQPEPPDEDPDSIDNHQLLIVNQETLSPGDIAEAVNKAVEGAVERIFQTVDKCIKYHKGIVD